MMKKSKIISLFLLLPLLGGLIYFVLNHPFERKIKVLDCEGVYHQKLFEKPKPGYLDFSIDTAKVESANCLCEKYMKSKDVKYKKEILNLFENYKAITIIPDAIYKNPRYKVDSICKYKNMVFATGIEL